MGTKLRLWVATEETNLVSILFQWHTWIIIIGWLNLPRKNDHITVVNNYLAETTFILQSMWMHECYKKKEKKKQCRNKHLTSCIQTQQSAQNL